MNYQYSHTYNKGPEMSKSEIYQAGAAKAETEARASVLDLEDYAFALLNQLTDEYYHVEDGSITRAIWDANTPEEMQPIIDQLEATLLIAMKTAAGM